MVVKYLNKVFHLIEFTKRFYRMYSSFFILKFISDIENRPGIRSYFYIFLCIKINSLENLLTRYIENEIWTVFKNDYEFAE